MLSFAAGAMVYVVIEEVVPETQRDKSQQLSAPLGRDQTTDVCS